MLVLDEFRLHAADTDGAAARIVSTSMRDARDPVPLLTSIDDPRDVATLRSVIAGAGDRGGPRGDAALGPLVATWQASKRYLSRISERSTRLRPSSFRLAVTESGINDEKVVSPRQSTGALVSGEPVTLLVIGVPEGTHAGLLVLVGRDATQAVPGGHDRTGWPLSLSHDLGVRIYASAAGARAPGPS